MHSAGLPFPTLSSDYGSASCPSSFSPPPRSQPRVCSLLSETSGSSWNVPSCSSSSCSQFAFTFSVLPPPTSLFLPLWQPALTVCLRCLSVFGHMLPTFLFHFSFPSEPERAQGESGFLTSCSLWGQATIMYPLARGGLCFLLSSLRI